jgi:hypothetical protein
LVTTTTGASISDLTWVVRQLNVQPKTPATHAKRRSTLQNAAEDVRSVCILNTGLKVMLALGVHAVTSCAKEATVSTAAMEVEVLALVHTATWIDLSASPWVAAAPGAGNKVRQKSSSRHGILTPVNLLNCLANPNTQAVLRSKAALIKTNVMMYRSSQQKDSGRGGGGGGGGGGGMCKRYAGVVHVRVMV